MDDSIDIAYELFMKIASEIHARPALISAQETARIEYSRLNNEQVEAALALTAGQRSQTPGFHSVFSISELQKRSIDAGNAVKEYHAWISAQEPKWKEEWRNMRADRLREVGISDELRDYAVKLHRSRLNSSQTDGQTVSPVASPAADTRAHDESDGHDVHRQRDSAGSTSGPPAEPARPPSATRGSSKRAGTATGGTPRSHKRPRLAHSIGLDLSSIRLDITEESGDLSNNGDTVIRTTETMTRAQRRDVKLGNVPASYWASDASPSQVYMTWAGPKTASNRVSAFVTVLILPMGGDLTKWGVEGRFEDSELMDPLPDSVEWNDQDKRCQWKEGHRDSSKRHYPVRFFVAEKIQWISLECLIRFTESTRGEFKARNLHIFHKMPARNWIKDRKNEARQSKGPRGRIREVRMSASREGSRHFTNTSIVDTSEPLELGEGSAAHVATHPRYELAGNNLTRPMGGLNNEGSDDLGATHGRVEHEDGNTLVSRRSVTLAPDVYSHPGSPDVPLREPTLLREAPRHRESEPIESHTRLFNDQQSRQRASSRSRLRHEQLSGGTVAPEAVMAHDLSHLAPIIDLSD
jgi:hypothetical protein